MRSRRKSTVKRDLYQYNLQDYDLDAQIVFTNKPPGQKWEGYRPPGQASALKSTQPQPAANPTPLEESSDPLAPMLYLQHHQRMEREEAKVMEQDRQRVVQGADKIFDQKAALEGVFWQRHISQIVKIDNMRDAHELKTKRRLAIEEMDKFIERFNRMEAGRRTHRSQSPKRKPSRPSSTSTARSASRPPSRPSSRPSSRTPPPPPPPSPPPKIWLHVPCRAFGVCLPPIGWRTEFELPVSWVYERELATMLATPPSPPPQP